VNHTFGIVIEGLVAVLLVVTIGYCMLLNKRLQRLKSDEQSLKATIGELITATEIAERAIGGLKHAVRDVNENLGEQLASANEMSQVLTKQLAEGDDVLRRLSKIAAAARPLPAPQVAPEPPRISAAKATVAAAQAFAERRRASGIAA
jgi:Tfp pilus assembly protein PilO